MVGVWVVFFVVVGPVLGSSIPVVAELVLGGAAMEPPEAHIHHFALARNDSIVGKSPSCGIVCLDRAFRLGPPHVDEGLAVGYHFTCCDEKYSKLRIGCRCHYKIDDPDNRENHTVCGKGSSSERKT